MPPAMATDFVVFVFQPQPSIVDRLKSAIGLAKNAKTDAVEFAELLTVLQNTEAADSPSYGGAINPDGDDDTPECDGDGELPQVRFRVRADTRMA